MFWNKKRASFEGFDSKGIEEEGLRILINLVGNGNPSSSSSNVIKPCSKMIKPIFCFTHITSFTGSSDDNDPKPHYCFLKSCHLCHKFLRLDKEVYMYRGDLGFCSLECRDRQIYVDEMEEIKMSTKKILASLRQRRLDGARNRCEDGGFSEELRHRRFSSLNNPVIFSYS